MVRSWVASSERIASWAAVVAGLVLAVPILVVRYPPMGDLAMHEGTIGVMRHLHDPSWVPAGLYYVVAPQANQLFALAALGLSFLLPTDVACKLLVAAIVGSTPPLAAHLLARLGRSRWLAPLVGPIVCGWMFRWGLVANLAGFALLLFALPELERLARRPSVGAIVRTSACGGLLLFAHVTSALIFAAIASLFAVIRSCAWRGLLARLAPVTAMGVLAFLQWRLSQHLLAPELRSFGSDFGPEPLERLAILPGAVFGGIGAARVAILGGTWVAALVTSASSAARAQRGRTGERSPWPLRIALWRHRYAVLTALLLLLYFVFPMTIARSTLLAHRFLAAACACLIVACARPRGRTTALTTVLAVASPLVLLGVELHAFASADADYRALDRILPLVPRGVAVAQLDLTPRGPGHVGPVPGASGRVLAERGGRMLFAMTDMTPNPLYLKPDAAWNEPVARMANAPYAFMPAYDLTRFSLLLERNESPAARAAVARALAPEAELVLESGPWSLFRSRLDVVALDAPDRPLPSPAPETLGARIERARRTPPPP